MQITIIKRKTKAFRLSVNKNCIVRLSAPLYSTKSQIDAFLSTHKEWLDKTLEKVKARQSELEKRLADNEGKILYLGVWYKLNFDEQLKQVTAENGAIYCKDEKALKVWQKKEALRIFTPKCLEIASFYGVEVSKISVRFAKSRWGSCSIGGAISLNINLIKAPRSVIEYVIVHEVAHRKEHNHSKNFWNEVKKLCNDYKTCEKWLKDNGWALI